jgi:hypothetical protein
MSRMNNMVNHQINRNNYSFREYILNLTIKNIDMPILLDYFCFINLRKHNYLIEIQAK